MRNLGRMYNSRSIGLDAIRTMPFANRLTIAFVKSY